MFDVYASVCSKYNIRQSEWFGGIYIDVDGTLCIQAVAGYQEFPECEAVLAMLGKETVIRIETVEYSYRFLEQQRRRILQEAENARIPGIAGAAVHEEKNRVTLAVTDAWRAKNAMLPGKDFDRVFEIRHLTGYRKNTALNASDTLSDGKSSFSAGYAAQSKSGINGIVTAGHIQGIYKDMEVFYGGSPVGAVHAYEDSENMDAAFIKLDKGNTCANKIPFPPGPEFSGTAPACISGTAVELFSGMGSSAYAGRIVYPEFDFMNEKNVMVFSYVSKDGDSGAPILLASPRKERMLAAIHTGTFLMNGEIYSFGRSARQINSHFDLKI